MWKKVLAALLLLIASAGHFSSTNARSIASAPVKFDGRVYAFRGDMGIFFSTGMDYLAAELNQLGLTAGVYNWVDWIALADDAIARYQAAPDRTRILLAGHSRGGDATRRHGLAVVRCSGSGGTCGGVRSDPCGRSGSAQCGTLHQFLSVHQ